MPHEQSRALRICVVGNSGSGKSTMAAALSGRIGVPAIELDSIFHQPGWTQLEPTEFRARVSAALNAATSTHGGWIADGNYSRHVSDLTVGQADVVVWFDLSRSRVMWQLTRRTLVRVSTRRELWNGNTERVSNLVKWNPENNILRWAWTQHNVYRRKYLALQESSSARWIRVRNPRERDEALAALTIEHAD